MNSVTRMPQQQIIDPASGWTWDGSQWVCGDCGPPVPCPSPFPPAFSGPAQQPPWYPGANGGVSFSTLPPPNPVRGHFWWNGVTLSMFDGAAWVGVGGASGGGTPPSTNPPSNPQPGQQWFNGSTLFVWDGNAWVPVAGTQTFIQATAPAAPSPGDLWYDGTQLRIWDGSAWELVGPGATVGPVATTTKVFSVVQTTTLAIAGGGAWTILPITNVPNIDTMSGWNATTKQWKPTKAGNYLFFTRGYYGGGQTEAALALALNDSGALNPAATLLVALNAFSGVPTVGDYLMGSGMVHMNGTTDFVRLWGASDTTSFYVFSNMPIFEAWLLP